LAERLLVDFPEYYHYFSIPEFEHNGIKQQNRNRLLGRGIGVDGLKTGHAEEAGYGITASAKQGERRIILVVNGLENDKARVEEGDRLLRYGMREFQNKLIARKDQKLEEAEVWFGTEKTVALVSDKDLYITLPGSTPQGITFTVKYNGPLQAPISKGTKVADLVVGVPGQGEQLYPLVAAQDVPKNSGFSRIWSVIRYYLTGGA
jgi:D-alanyl-D-alanine carboxypeptidase (penicillin-binding protein 5/6)